MSIPYCNKLRMIIPTLQCGIITAAESTVDIVAGSENLKHLGQGSPETGTVEEEGEQDDADIENEECNVLAALEVDVLARHDVEDTAHTEGEPGVSGSGLNRDNGVEDGDSVGEDEGNDPEESSANHPGSP